MAALPSPMDAGPAVSGDAAFRPTPSALLRAMGHQIAAFEATDPVVARVEAILNQDGWLQGAADGRGNAKAEGY